MTPPILRRLVASSAPTFAPRANCSFALPHLPGEPAKAKAHGASWHFPKMSPPRQFDLGAALQQPVDVSMTGPMALASRNLAEQAAIAPHELMPARMHRITQHAPAGAYLGVGTERTFTAAALTPQVTRVIMADYDPRVVLYNHMNTALLKLGVHRSDYLSLRLQADHHDVCQTAKRVWGAKAPQSELLACPSTFNWFVQQVRHSGNPNMAAFHERPSHYVFEGGNYLHDDVLYNRVARLAKQDLMHPILMNIGCSADVDALVTGLCRRGEHLSLVDISNLWEQRRMGNSLWGKLATRLHSVAAPSAILMGTAAAWIDTYPEFDHRAEAPRWDTRAEALRFTYFGTRLAASQTQGQNAAIGAMLKGLDKATRAGTPADHEVEKLDGHLETKQPDA